MYFEKDMIEKLADIARVNLKEEEKNTIIEKTNELLLNLKKLDEIDTSNVNPTEKLGPEKSIFRRDEVTESLSLDDVFKNAPDKYKHFFRVPKIIED